MPSQSAIGIGSLLAAFVLSVSPSSAQAPPSAAEAQAAIDRSPRHGEWVSIDCPPVRIKSWVMYPERSDRAPVVMVIHPGAVLDDWTRAIADRLAADGYIAVAPDLGPQLHVTALDAVREYALKIPAANGKVAVLGFEQGGNTALEYANAQPALNAAVAISASIFPPIDRSAEGRFSEGRAAVLLLSHDFSNERNAADAGQAATQRAWARVLAFLGGLLQ